MTTLTLPSGGFRLEDGGSLARIDVAWESCGRETPANDNVVFICHALTGDAHVAGRRPLNHHIITGVAMNTEEYVPAMTPMSIVSAKSKIEPSPNANSAATAKNVVTDVITVRLRHSLSARLQSSLKPVF